jgi:hypothetical protein
VTGQGCSTGGERLGCARDDVPVLTGTWQHKAGSALLVAMGPTGLGSLADRS